MSRRGGYAPIESYAIIGDGRTVALVASDGRIDWWPLPTLAAPPVCAAIVDEEGGGHFSLAPVPEHTVSRRYVPRTNVLETTYRAATGTVRVLDALNAGHAGRLAWTELARRVEGVEGQVEMAWELLPGNRFTSARPWTAVRGGVPVTTVGDQTLALVCDGIPPADVLAHGVRGRFNSNSGRRQLVGLVGTDREPLPLPSPSAVSARIDHTIESWRRWSEALTDDGPWAGAVQRSALALKTLIFEPTGAMAAAATTSLPERIGGEKNWDYRYAWVRDTSFALDALINLGLDEEVHSTVSWLVSALRRSAPDLHVFYTLDGDRSDEEATLNAPGYRGSRPVRAGNRAEHQIQLGNYGDLFDTICRYVSAGHILDEKTGRLLSDLADACCDSWLTKDSGIWELPSLEHYTISKIGCWVALDRAARLADEGHLPVAHAARWRSEAAEVRDWVNQNCWSDQKRSYTLHAGTDRLDAAVLLAGRTGFERGERLQGTIEALRRELARGPLLYRYSGMESEEGAFVACTFWLVDALTRVGRRKDAHELMDEAVGLASDVGLLSEEIDPESHAFLGNMPQGLSHLALINAAHALQER